MAQKVKRVLLIEDEPVDVDVVKRFLVLAGGKDFQLDVTVSMAQAQPLLKTEEPVDLILLDQHLPDSSVTQSLKSILEQNPAVPVVVLTGQGTQDGGVLHLRQGAQDYLIKGQFDAQLLVRVMRHAMERATLLREVADLKRREQHERDLKALELLARQTAAAAQSTAEFQKTSPAIFKKMMEDYLHILDKAIEHRVYHTDGSSYAQGVRDLAHELMRVFAGPREVVELHAAAIETRLHSQKSDLKGQAYLEEGRIVLLKILGGLVTAYRGAVSAAHAPA